jgi:hypothetical protein
VQQPGLRLVPEPGCRGEARGEDRRRQAVLDGVCTLERLVERCEAVQGRDRAEDLLAREERIVGDVLEERRVDQVPVRALAYAA